MNRLRITEIFYSLQGESRTVGLPTVFVRLTGCPLRCVYCDTAYAFGGGHKMSIDEIVEEIGSYRPRYVTVTGGEPLAQRGCLALLDTLVDKGYEVSLETSGALDVSEVNPKVVKVLDLKTPSSGEESKNRYRNLDFLDRKDQLKFVIMNDADYQWAKAKMEEHGLPERCEVLFSPAIGTQNPAELAEKVLRDRLKVRFQVQLHKILWGDMPGH
ncbi:7-carboxy-7-deazaguanine synthase QueE [Methylocaldum sp. MU1018]